MSLRQIKPFKFKKSGCLVGLRFIQFGFHGLRVCIGILIVQTSHQITKACWSWSDQPTH
ncbi:hypothetical protein HanRHA438_Chr04g0186101 [Helianthus annuus]|nr:hypothetical protein HanRHA438_Chr04g0186101 [Helianthus annuus]